MGRQTETKLRSVVKALGWNVLGLAVMAAVGYGLTGSLRAGGEIAVINTAIGFAAYLVYERIWAGIGWGRHG